MFRFLSLQLLCKLYNLLLLFINFNLCFIFIYCYFNSLFLFYLIYCLVSQKLPSEGVQFSAAGIRVQGNTEGNIANFKQIIIENYGHCAKPTIQMQQKFGKSIDKQVDEDHK